MFGGPDFLTENSQALLVVGQVRAGGDKSCKAGEKKHVRQARLASGIDH